MRRMILLLALLSLCLTHALKAQIIDVYAGNDTIELRLGNYQYGFIQWQTSQDTVNWENIEGATDTIYRFLPEKNAYYRAMATFENCPQLASRICYVQVPPKANAGPDRKLMEGSGATMFASMGDDCVGRWEIIEGANGMLDSPNSPNAYFEGTDVEYKLKWTVTNACGSASDTITIRYYHTVLNENYIVVDTTDVLLSDSTQLINGRYLIAFSEPVTLNDSMLLCGVGEHGFLRKIVSYTYDAAMDVYDIETEQASVGDFLIEGVLSFDLNAMRRKDKVVFSHSYPTRKDIAKAGFKGVFFKLPDSSESTAAWDSGQKEWSINWTPGFLTLPWNTTILPTLSIEEPNVFFEIERDHLYLVDAKFGLESSFLSSFEFDIPESAAVTIKKDDFSLVDGPLPLTTVVLGPFEFGIKWDVTLGYDAKYTLGPKMNYMLQSRGKLQCYVLYDPSDSDGWSWHKGIDDFQLDFIGVDKPEYGDVSVKASIGASVSVMAYESIGLYFKPLAKLELKHNTFGEGFTAGEAKSGFDFAIGGKMQIWKKQIFDIHYTIPIIKFFEYKDPASIAVFSGNYQTFSPDNHLPEPIAVQVLNSRGKPSKGTLVKFVTDDGYFSNDKVYTNSYGIASTNWICGDNPTGVVKAKAYTYNIKHEPVGGGPLLIKAFHGNASVPDNCFHSTLAVTADVSTGLLRPKITGGLTPYRYSISGSTIPGSSVVPVLPQPGATYHISVWDGFDCYAECYYTHPSHDCFSSGLQVRVEQQGNTVTAMAEGGKSPYQFCLDDDSYSSTSVFSNLMDGRHVVYVRDANGCEEATVFTVETNGSGIGTGGGDDDGVTVTTSVVNVVDNTSATCGGSVSISGNAFVTQYGICWSTHHAPTTSDQYVQKAYNGNTFSNCLMTNLSSTEVYYVRAFAVTNTGTEYGEEVPFSTTTAVVPEVSDRVVNITSTSAKAWAYVTNHGGTPVTERGFCWGTSHNPSVSGTHVSCGNGTGYFNYSLTGLTPNTHYYLRAYATNSTGTSYGNEVEFTTLQNGGGGGNHEYVDLGLPSGILWATCNVGANSPEEYGDYFAWGETQPKDEYNWSTYQLCMSNYNTLTKYCNNSSYGYNGYTDNLTTLLPEDDAATANWGAGWRIPTQEEWQELLDNTTSTWTTQNGVRGRLFTAPNGHSLFLPAAGFRYESSLSFAGSDGDYWSSSLRTDVPTHAWNFYFDSDLCLMSGSLRGDGRSVRPVRSARKN